MRRSTIWLRWLPVVVLVACSSGSSSEFGGSLGANHGGGGSQSGSGGSQASADASPPVEGPAATVPGHGAVKVETVIPIAPESACAQSVIESKPSPLDLFIIQDRSLSMNDLTQSGATKWAALTEAVKAFVMDQRSVGIGGGIGFFSIFTDKADSPGLPTVSCDIERYVTPVVPIDDLARSGPQIVEEISKLSPQGETPGYPALAGAIRYARSWAKDHVNHRVVVVFSTDGLPNVCESSPEAVRNVARDGYFTSPNIKTYVIGLGAPTDESTFPNLNMFANAGGTGSAFMIDPTSPDTVQQFTAAMAAIRDAPQMGCQYNIPRAANGEITDLSQSTLLFASNGEERKMDWRPSVQECGEADGYYYDNNTKPTIVKLCPATCGRVDNKSTIKIQVLVGCAVFPEVPEAGTGGTPEPAPTGNEPAPPACLLYGQSCTDASDCCNGFCLGGRCQMPAPK